MSKDFYTILGVDKGAPKEEIKRAFHKLARKFHPDNKDTGDETRFKEINEAYQTLSDDNKKAEYDSYGHVFGDGAGGSAGFSGFSGFSAQSAQSAQGGSGWDMGDIFSDFFGGQGARSRVQRGRDISIDLTIPFSDAIFSTERAVLLAKTSLCDSCKGNGAEPHTQFEKCKVCNGQGRVHDTHNSFFGTLTSVRECVSCKGESKVPKAKCRTCRGIGVLKKQEEVIIKIPAGIHDGEVIRISGGGEAVTRGISGDLYTKIHVSPHPVFKRDGNNLILDLNIKLSDALLGSEYTIQTLDGGNLKLKIPAGVTFGEMLRVRGKGIPFDRGRCGDLLVKLHIKLPNHLSRKAKKLLEEMKGEGI